MVEVVPDVNLSFKEYQASLQQNPSNIFYQRVASRNVSNQQNCGQPGNKKRHDMTIDLRKRFIEPVRGQEEIDAHRRG